MLLWHRFGPYHRARYAAVRALIPAAGLEFSGVDPVYAWRAEAPPPGVSRLLKDRHSQEVPPAQLRVRMAEALEGIAPAALAIPGWSDRAPLAALEWAKDHGVPTVLMSPSQRDDAPRGRLKEWVKGRLVRLFDAALVGGGPQERYLRELGFPGGRIARGYNAVDNRHFAAGAARARAQAPALRRRLGLPRDYFLATARFVPKKNLEALLEAYARYRRGLGRRAWALVVLGDGPLRARLEALAAAPGLAGSVLFPGFRQYPELPAYYGLARAFVLPSLVEQWGLAVNEAMAASLPVLVSSRCGCAEDLVGDGANGWLLDPRDPAQMARRMERATLAGAAALRGMGRESFERVGRHSPEAFAGSLARAVEWARPLPGRPLDPFTRLLLRRVMASSQAERQEA